MNYNNRLYPFKGCAITLNGETLHYVDEGSGQVILFCHAPLGSSFMYRKFISALSKTHRCIALDFPGFGASPGSNHKKYSILSQSKILGEFISALKLTDIVGFGHDTGGPSLTKVVVDQPELFAGLILSDTLLFPVGEYPSVRRMLRFVGSNLFQAINAYTNLLVRLTFSLGVRTRKLRREEIVVYRRMFANPSQRRRITEMLYSLLREKAMIDRIQALFTPPHNRIPALILFGEDDPIARLQVADRLHKSLPYSELHYIPKAGHFPHEGRPEEMIELIATWLKNVSTNQLQSMAI